MVGDGGGFWSFLHVDDAAAATAIAVVRGTPGLYNIVDDDPAPVSDWLPALAAMVGGKSPRRIPRWLGRIAAGEHLVSMMTENRAGSNAKARSELRWRPAHASWRQGFAEVPPAAADLGQNPIGASVGVCLAGRPPREDDRLNDGNAEMAAIRRRQANGPNRP